MCSMVSPLSVHLQGAVQAALAPLHASWQGGLEIVSISMSGRCCATARGLPLSAGRHACRSACAAALNEPYVILRSCALLRNSHAAQCTQHWGELPASHSCT